MNLKKVQISLWLWTIQGIVRKQIEPRLHIIQKLEGNQLTKNCVCSSIWVLRYSRNLFFLFVRFIMQIQQLNDGYNFLKRGGKVKTTLFRRSLKP